LFSFYAHGAGADPLSLSLPGLTRQSIAFEKGLILWMDARVKPAHDEV
jgi:hypothetical protein